MKYTLSQLIQQLQELQAIHGDVERVVTEDCYLVLGARAITTHVEAFEFADQNDCYDDSTNPVPLIVLRAE